jgi:putative phage-type endonuclease
MGRRTLIGAPPPSETSMVEELKITSAKKWLEAKKTGIGGSEISVLMGVNPYATPLQLYESKIGIGHDIEQNEQMTAGLRLESYIARAFRKEKPEYKIINPRTLYRRDAIALGTPDRLLAINGEVVGILELKNTTYWSKVKRTMASYQVQWYLYVLGLQFGYVCALEQGWKVHIQPILRDDEFIERMRTKADTFWFNHVEQRLPPNDESSGLRLSVPSEFTSAF